MSITVERNSNVADNKMTIVNSQKRHDSQLVFNMPVQSTIDLKAKSSAEYELIWETLLSAKFSKVRVRVQEATVST
jgi:hypothetical protein